MKLLYIANLRLPTEKAYGIQIVKMCESFAAQHNTNLRTNADATNDANKIKIELVAPYRKNKIKEDLIGYYGVKRNFQFRKIWAPDFYLPGRLDKITVNIKNFISAILLCFYTLTKKADIIYTRDEWPAYFLSFLKNNAIFEAHKFPRPRSFFYRRFKKKNLKIVTISHGLKSKFIELGFKRENILVAPDGVDLQEFDISVSQKEARSRVGLPQDKKIIMYTGHLFEWKGAGVLLEAARLITNFEKILFVFVGGTEYDIKKFREKAEGSDNMLILGHKPHKEIPLYLKAADVLVLPNSDKEEISKSYTSPLKLFEYMASGRPIVASDLVSIREILNEKNSILVKPDDPDSLAGGIVKILNDGSLGERLAEKAGKEAENYTWDKRAASVLAFIG